MARRKGPRKQRRRERRKGSPSSTKKWSAGEQFAFYRLQARHALEYVKSLDLSEEDAEFAIQAITAFPEVRPVDMKRTQTAIKHAADTLGRPSSPRSREAIYGALHEGYDKASAEQAA